MQTLYQPQMGEVLKRVSPLQAAWGSDFRCENRARTWWSGGCLLLHVTLLAHAAFCI